MKLQLQRFYIHLACVSIAGNILLVYILKQYYMTVRVLIPADQSVRFSASSEGSNQRVSSNGLLSDISGMKIDEETGNFTFLINARNSCSWNRKDKAAQKFAVVVVSKIDNFVLRDAIRKTWGSFDRKLGSLVFLVGTTSKTTVQKQLLKEVTLHNDVIQVNVTDSYDLLTYKSMAMLEWLYLFCRNADFYLKADDDAFINMENIANATAKFKVKRFLLCSVFINVRPIRNKKSKWYVPEEQYDGKHYPTYCSGPAYVFSSNVLPDLYKSALTSKFCAMEDIYITGIAASKLGITYIHSRKFIYDWHSKSIGCGIIDLFSIHRVGTNDILKLHSFSTRNRQNCETEQAK